MNRGENYSLNGILGCNCTCNCFDFFVRVQNNQIIKSALSVAQGRCRQNGA